MQDLQNTIGNIPVSWYDNYPHIGYDIGGQPIAKTEGTSRSQIEEFLAKMEDPDYWFVRM